MVRPEWGLLYGSGRSLRAAHDPHSERVRQKLGGARAGSISKRCMRELLAHVNALLLDGGVHTLSVRSRGDPILRIAEHTGGCYYDFTGQIGGPRASAWDV